MKDLIEEKLVFFILSVPRKIMLQQENFATVNIILTQNRYFFAKNLLTFKNVNVNMRLHYERRNGMKRKLRKPMNDSGSLIFTIPKGIVDLLDLEPYAEVDIELKGKKIIINTETKEEQGEIFYGNRTISSI